VRFNNLTLQIQSQTFRHSLARCDVLVCRHLDHTLSLYYGPHCLGRYDWEGKLLWAPGSARKRRTAKTLRHCEVLRLDRVVLSLNTGRPQEALRLLLGWKLWKLPPSL